MIVTMNEPREKSKEVRNPSLTSFFKKVITSAYPKSSNSLGFNPIWHNVY